MNLDVRTRREKIDEFARLMVSNGGPVGMRIAPPRIESADTRRSNWTDYLKPQHFGYPELMVVIVPEQPKGIYGKITEVNRNVLLDYKPPNMNEVS
ncbi:hypothetical protein J437_LFUL006658 [Ladona fulva]|uniref:Uncharacterized protein n=1 Tax=Ladona fulva TaxID=123851 RepID=A0A8K0K7R3_LADFU|nr:hypothetical protein J437_LFUL006658 [Ladona fulva]